MSKPYKTSGSSYPHLMHIFEISTSGWYSIDMKALKILASGFMDFGIYGISKKCQIYSMINFVSNNLWSWTFTVRRFLTQEIWKWNQNCPKTYWFWTIWKLYINLPFSMYLWKKKMWHYSWVIFLFQITVSNVINLMWWKNELKFFT